MPERRLLRTTVTDVTWLTPAMVRIVVGGPDLADFSAGRFSDEYVKCRFGDRTRSYTWAAAARPGDTLELTGPGGSYAPSADADWHLMSGDDAVIPAIAASLRRVRPGVPVFVVLEVDGTEHEHPLESPGDLQVTWIHRRAGAGEDASLQAAAVRRLFLPAGRGQAFVHGEATAVRLVRRHLLERGLPIDALSATGYWKLRRTDEQWRAEKPEWKRDADADAAQLRAAG
jgi:NADPH-dependent ferric siderophore reductase